MTQRKQVDRGDRHRQKHSARAIALSLLLTVLLSQPLVPVQSSPQAAAVPEGASQTALRTVSAAPAAPLAQVAQTDTITLKVVSARTEPRAGVVKGDPVPEYHFQIVEDNTGDPFDDTDCFAFLDYPENTIRNPNYPDGCDWPGVRTNPPWAPIVTQGTQDHLNETTGITLPPGKYLISVMAEDYRVDGEHLTVPLPEPGLVEVAVHPHPLPPASMVIQVFHDRSMTNGQFDGPVEASVCPGPSCMEGFRLSLNDIAGEITADLFGNPLCTIYLHDEDGNVVFDEEGNPIIEQMGGECLSDENGVIHVPNIGTIRFDVLVVPPDGQQWIQTTTLEGSQGWDTWLQEAGTGLDNEFIVAAEPFPWTIFGFVVPTDTLTVGLDDGSIIGVIMASETYVPTQGGLPYEGRIWGGFMGTKVTRPIAYPWVALNDLQNGDTAVWVGRGDADGNFEIQNVPPGDYLLSYWDEKQHYILDWMQVTVHPDQVTDIGVRTMTGWFTEWYGTVFHDLNENGRRDPGEPGVPNYPVVIRDRDNTEIDRMSIMAMTDVNGFYELEKGYPMAHWQVLEAASDVYRPTGVTYQAGNQPDETTVLGSIVNVGVLPILGMSGRVDWGVVPYEPGTNGGVYGTVFYDTVRAEDEARYAGAEPWQPGISDLELRLYATVKNPDGSFVFEEDGSYMKGPLLATTTTEDFVRPKDCIPRGVDGEEVVFPSLPPSTGGYDCLEAPLMGVQFSQGQQELPGNWGFGEIMTDTAGNPLPEPLPIPMGDYLVEVVIPKDPYTGEPVYELTREEDLNIYDGDVFFPDIPPPPCAGPLHVVDVLGIPPDGPDAVYNPGYAEVGGSRFEGEEMPLCNVKLANVGDQKGLTMIFTLWTKVPIPGRWRGYIIDDLNVSTDPHELTFGEMAGMKYMPIGVYDFTGRLVHTIHSDFHGVYEVILPSVATYNAPTPSGMNASMYYIYGNDPGQLGNLNPTYNPQYRSIGTSFEIYPGVIVPSDLAPIQNGVSIWNPGSQQNVLATCALDETTPQIYAVDKPYIEDQGNITIGGLGFGTYDPDNSRSAVWLGTNRLDIVSWTDREIVAFVGRNVAAGPHELRIVASNNQTTVNGLTIHVLRPRIGQRPGYTPNLYEVGPGQTYDPTDPLYADEGRGPIQHAIDDAWESPGEDVVVVYPSASIPFTNPLGIHFENPVIYSPVKLQGIGPGGVYTDGTGILGSILDGRGMGGTEEYAEWWRVNLGDIWLNRGGWDGSPVDNDGNPRIYEGPVVTVFAEDGEFLSGFHASIDGFKIQGGDQQGFPNHLFKMGGGKIPGVPAEVVVQGGAIFVNGYARHMRISNNVIQSNGGAYAGAIRLGTPDVPEPLTDHQNDHMVIARNRILANGGTNLAGAIGVFAGAENYEIAHNDICGNFSAEYGGGISHYGYSPGGRIHHNRIYFNRSYDEGGGIMIAGELPADPAQLSPGAGPVDVYANLIQANLANDDGGGLRFLMAGNFAYNVYNNIIVNNVSTHEGGGVSLNDAPDVRFYNNTVMNNITTATAMTSNGLPAPAGFSSSRNSNLLQATLPVDWPEFGDALMFNNIFWDNRAGTWTGGGVAGIGLEGDPSPIFYWDLGVAGNAGELSPTYTLMQVQNGVPDGSNLVGMDPLVVAEFDSSVRVFPWRGNHNFVGADIVAVELPVGLMGDYHLAEGSPAINAGTSGAGGIPAPNQDYDGQPRPSQGRFEMGADETGAAFPNTGVLFPAGEPVEPKGITQAPHTVWLAVVVRGGSWIGPEWGGDTESFVFDEATGIEVLESGVVYWQKELFNRDQEAYFTFTGPSSTATRQDLLLKLGGLAGGGLVGGDLMGVNTYLIDVGYDATAGTVQVATLSPGSVWQTHTTFGGLSFVAGDTLGARATQGGIVEVYQNGLLIGRADLSAGDNLWPYYGQAGHIGLWFEWPLLTPPDEASLTDFGGGTMPW